MLYSNLRFAPIAEMSEQIEIPNRALLKASEVCDLLKVQPYVLRTWEAEFHDLGVPKGSSGARVYRREDIERVQRIKHMLLIEGLTLAGARRKLEEESHSVASGAPVEPESLVVDASVRDRIADVRRALQSLLDLLDTPGDAYQAASGFSLEPMGSAADSGHDRGHTAAAKGASPKRKRSA